MAVGRLPEFSELGSHIGLGLSLWQAELQQGANRARSLHPPPPGLHSADNIHEFSNAMNMGLTLRDLKFNVHAHPTVAEVGTAGGTACPMLLLLSLV